MQQEENFVLGLQGAGALLLRQWWALDSLIPFDASVLGSPLSAGLFIGTFLETSLHCLLMMALVVERRWRFLVTLWLYLGYRLMFLHMVVAVVTILLGIQTVWAALAPVVIYWITWYNTYQHVEKDQKARDLRRAGGQLPGGGRAARSVTGGIPAGGHRGRVPPAGTHRAEPGGETPGQLQVLLDPTGLYLLAPSHSDPPLPRVPFWEEDLDSWRSMARINNAVNWLFRQLVVNILAAGGVENLGSA